MTPPLLNSAHIGLRGALVGWILLFHAVLYSLGWNLQGSALMPIFYLLSGFSLAVAYGGTPLHIGRFFRNRFARIAPVYYVCMALALPLAWFGHSWVSPELIGRTALTNLFAVQMWFGTPPLSFVGPAWTISTLVFFYLAFPLLMTWHKKHSDRALARWLWVLFWAQLVIYFALTVVLDPYDKATAFWAAHAWPVSRLPVFDMGLVAGLLVARRAPVMGIAPDAGRRWSGKVDRNAAILTACLVSFSVLSVAWKDLLASWWMQGIFPYLLLQLIVGLSLTTPNSCVTQRVLTGTPMQALGRIALPLYLSHEVVIYAVAWATQPDQPFYFAVMPVWAIIVVVPVSLILSWALFRIVENPARAMLRAPRPAI